MPRKDTLPADDVASVVGTDVAMMPSNPLEVLTDRAKFNQFYEDVKRQTETLVPDVTTERGRKAIASMARKVASTKTAIDAAGKTLNEEARERINKVDAARREIRERLDALRDEVRAPLTEWGAAEDLRIAGCAAVISDLRTFSVVLSDDNAGEIRMRIGELEVMTFDPVDMAGYVEIAENLRRSAIETLTPILARLEKEEVDRVELEALRAANAERLAREQAEKEAAEEARLTKERAERAEMEEIRLAAEAQSRIEAAAKAAAEAAQRETEQKAAQEAAEIKRVADEALEAERKRADDAEAARQADIAKAAREKAQQEAEAKRLADEQAKRDRNKRHVTEVMTAAKLAIMSCGADEDTARKIVMLIKAGDVPHISIVF